MKNPIKVIEEHLCSYSEKKKYQVLLMEIANYLHTKGIS